jgi:hypothetical protein
MRYILTNKIVPDYNVNFTLDKALGLKKGWKEYAYEFGSSYTGSRLSGILWASERAVAQSYMDVLRGQGSTRPKLLPKK